MISRASIVIRWLLSSKEFISNQYQPPLGFGYENIIKNGAPFLDSILLFDLNVLNIFIMKLNKLFRFMKLCFIATAYLEYCSLLNGFSNGYFKLPFSTVS